MKWRYQPVIVGVPGDEVVRLVEAHFDDDGKLEMWTDENGIEPQGETPIELTQDLCRMLVDAYSWQPVRYDDLKTGMVIQKIITMEQRNALADFTETIGHNFEQARKK